MTEKLTRIKLPGVQGASLMDWGTHSPADMIGQLRSYAASQIEWATKVMEADDADFQIDVVRGSAVQHHVSTLQSARSKEIDSQ